jgi:SAM-dependent methyltransferase
MSVASSEVKANVSRPAPRRFLNAGSGPHGSKQIHALFDPLRWQETRLDIDPAMHPDIVGSFVDLGGKVDDATFDAIWSSHALEHLHTHEVPKALAEFRRVLKPSGFALLRCPDLEVIASLLVRYGPDHVAYTASVGPITPLDMLYGHSASIARGRTSMAHHTGFTAQRMADLCLAAGFATVMTKTEYFDLWTVALLAEADKDGLVESLASAGLLMADQPEDAELAG